MKRILICTALLLSSLLLYAAGPEKEPYFCTRPGTKLYYERTKAGTTKLTQTTLFEIESAEPSAKGRTIHYAVTMAKASGRELMGGRALQTTYISPNGDTSLDFGETVKGFVRNMFPSAKIEVSSSEALLPVNMQPGDTLSEIHSTVKVMGINAYFHVTGRKVLRRETVTTPAGTFDCMVVREFKEEDAPLHHTDNWLDNYYVHGLGYVRHDKYDKNMHLLEREVLVNIENPASSDARH